MKDVMIVLPDKCVGCNVCVRNCPVPEATVVSKMDNGRIVMSVNADKCIGCGECIRSCTHGARSYVDDTDNCMSHLAEEKMVVLVDPAIKILYPTKWKSILDWFKKKNCIVYDASFGSDISTWATMRIVNMGKTPNVISQSCAATLNYVKMYQPDLIKNMIAVHSSEVCMAIFVKNYLRRTNPVLLISPCIAKKIEHLDSGFIDYDVTFENLMKYFEKNDIVIPASNYADFEYDFENKGMPQMGFMCERQGGLAQNLLDHNMNVPSISSSGMQKVYSELKMFAKTNQTKLPALYDGLTCSYGCCSGPASGVNINLFENIVSMQHLEDDARSNINKGKMFRTANDDKLFKKFDDELEFGDFVRTYKFSQPTTIPTNDKIDAAFASMNKHTDAEKCYNCGCCGFDTCKDMAIAVARDLNIKENCAEYMKGCTNTGKTAEPARIPKETIDDIKSITKTLEEITSTHNNNSGKMKTVDTLLHNIVTFCEKNKTMNEAHVNQMIKILETIISAMQTFSDNTEAIQLSVDDIKDIVNRIESSPLFKNS